MIATLNECFNGDLEVSVEIGDAPAADGDGNGDGNGAPPLMKVGDTIAPAVKQPQFRKIP